MRRIRFAATLLGAAALLAACRGADEAASTRELAGLRQQVRELRRQLKRVRLTLEDVVSQLQNLDELVKHVRRQVGRNGDAIAGLRDHITLTVRALAPAASGAGKTSAVAREALVEGLRKMGVILNLQEKSLALEGVVAVPRGALEFACVAEGGKAHESLFLLRCEPRAVHAGLLALGLQPGTPGRFQDGKPVSPTGPKVYLYATWTVDGKEVTHRVEDLVLNVHTGKVMPRVGFVFTGSRFQTNSVTGKRFFAADVTRDLVALWNNPNTVLDNPLPEAAWDDTYVARAELMPPKGTPVKVELRVEER